PTSRAVLGEAVAPAEAANDRAGPGENVLGVRRNVAVVDARRPEARPGRAQQGESAPYAIPDHADLPGAVLAVGQRDSRRLDVIEDPAAASSQRAKRRLET